MARVIALVEGGLVQAIYTDDPAHIDVAVLDMDNMKVEEDEESLARMERLEKEIEKMEQVY